MGLATLGKLQCIATWTQFSRKVEKI